MGAQEGENKAALTVTEASGAAKYAAKLQEYVWTNKRKIAAARVEGQRAKLATAQKHRKTFNVLKSSQQIALPGISNGDLEKAKTALKASVSAVKEAKAAENTVENDARDQQHREEKQIKQTLDIWKKVQDTAIDGAVHLDDVKLRNMNHL